MVTKYTCIFAAMAITFLFCIYGKNTSFSYFNVISKSILGFKKATHIYETLYFPFLGSVIGMFSNLLAFFIFF